MSSALKSVVSTKFIGLITSGSAGLGPYIIHVDLASGPQTHIYNFDSHWSSTLGRCEIIFIGLCSPFPNIPAPLSCLPSGGWHCCAPNCPGQNVNIIYDASFLTFHIWPIPNPVSFYLLTMF